MAAQEVTVAQSRNLLLDAVAGADITFYRSGGNRGDDLIEAGERALFDGAGIPYRYLHAEVIEDYAGDLLFIGGGGGWCRFWDHSVGVLAGAERFERVVVSPSTFDPHDILVRDALRDTRARLFARDTVSAALVPRATLAHCPSFFFDFTPYHQPGEGILHAFRTDHERAPDVIIPGDNVDISLVAPDLSAWLGVIAAHVEVHTDRAHVAVAAALLGKRVRWRDSGYFKTRAVIETWLTDYDVAELP
jgi:hypothetical protein